VVPVREAIVYELQLKSQSFEMAVNPPVDAFSVPVQLRYEGRLLGN